MDAAQSKAKVFSHKLPGMVAGLFLWTLTVSGAGVTLEWGPSPDPYVAGYALYYGTASGNYSQRLDVGNQTTATVTNLTPGERYYFVVTAYNILGLESEPSNEVAYDVPATVPTNEPPRVIAGPDQTVFGPATANLQGTVTDDGLPIIPGSVATTWFVLSGPGTVTFANSNAVATTATFSTPGAYVVCLKAFDGELISTNDLTVTVLASSDPAPFISSFNVTAQGAALAWTSLPGRLYRVVYKDDLKAAQWSVASPDLSSTGSSMNWVDASAVPSGQRFYSVVLLP
ncbi:MAG: fibronectin type III domain-containing protein [Verrucomicrobia bacterium]|nr:fibronectin type III domain-containing protein [Verrucomicrobiota bacterium]